MRQTMCSFYSSVTHWQRVCFYLLCLSYMFLWSTSNTLYKFIEFIKAENVGRKKNTPRCWEKKSTLKLNMHHMVVLCCCVLSFDHFCSFTFQIMEFLDEMLKSGSNRSATHSNRWHRKQNKKCTQKFEAKFEK